MRRICVYSGSNSGFRPEYCVAAKALGRELVSRDFGLVYGGTSTGLMAAVADSVLANGGHVTGVIPTMLAERGVGHDDLSELRIVSSMHERKAEMAELSAGFIALPGGIGTLEEVFEVLAWTQLGIHGKPCGLLNVCGYYSSLVRFLEHARAEGFVNEAHKSMLLTEDDPAAMLDRFERYRAPKVSKLIDHSDHDRTGNQ